MVYPENKKMSKMFTSRTAQSNGKELLAIHLIGDDQLQPEPAAPYVHSYTPSILSINDHVSCKLELLLTALTGFNNTNLYRLY
jgi:hypothetical protein